MSMMRQILGKGRIRWWMMCHLPAWPWKRCVTCGRVFVRSCPWWANAFEEHCSRACADEELAYLYAMDAKGTGGNHEHDRNENSPLRS